MIEPFLDFIICPRCGKGLDTRSGNSWHCPSCSMEIPLLNGTPLFTPVPVDIIPSEKLSRSADSGSRWRQANWKFLEREVQKLTPQARILDVGCGRGDFSALFSAHSFLELDIYPYPEVDVVCDLSSCVPFRENSFDVIALLNVIEHVQDALSLLQVIYRLLAPGGCALISIPFMLKIHQAPIDYVRFTHFALRAMADQIGFQVEGLDGFVDPAGLIVEAARYYRFWELPDLNFLQRIMARLFLFDIRINAFFLELFSGRGRLKDTNLMKYPAPTGYHLVLRKALHRKRV